MEQTHHPKTSVFIYLKQDALLVLLLIGIGGISAALWYFRAARPILVPVSAALGSLFSGVSGFSSISTKAKVILVVLATALVGLGTWYPTFDLEHEKDSFQNKYTLMRETFLNYAKALNDDGRSTLLLQLAKDLRQGNGSRRFEDVMDLSNFVLDVSPNNGHGLYFSGEVSRIKGDREQMRGQFDRYLSIENHLPLDERDGDAEICYKERPDGFCAERTGWIEHLLANDFYHLASRAKDNAAKASDLKSACNYLKGSVEHFPQGFHAYQTTLSSEDLKSRLQTEPRESSGDATHIDQRCIIVSLPVQPATPPARKP